MSTVRKDRAAALFSAAVDYLQNAGGTTIEAKQIVDRAQEHVNTETARRLYARGDREGWLSR
jgi:hypothetical protein